VTNDLSFRCVTGIDILVLDDLVMKR